MSTDIIQDDLAQEDADNLSVPSASNLPTTSEFNSMTPEQKAVQPTRTLNPNTVRNLKTIQSAASLGRSLLDRLPAEKPDASRMQQVLDGTRANSKVTVSGGLTGDLEWPNHIDPEEPKSQASQTALKLASGEYPEAREPITLGGLSLGEIPNNTPLPEDVARGITPTAITTDWLDTTAKTLDSERNNLQAESLPEANE